MKPNSPIFIAMRCPRGRAKVLEIMKGEITGDEVRLVLKWLSVEFEWVSAACRHYFQKTGNEQHENEAVIWGAAAMRIEEILMGKTPQEREMLMIYDEGTEPDMAAGPALVPQHSN